MNDQEILGLTDRGREELHSGATTLPPVELELLVRIDGTLTLAQLRAGMDKATNEQFQRALRYLQLANLVAPVKLDTFALQLQGELENFSQAKGEEADAGVRSLKRAGYFVRIAYRHPAAAAAAAAPGRPRTAVIVEDDAHLAGFVSSYLQFEGFQVRIAANREEVLAEFRKPPVPNLVLLDVVLPDVNGFEVLASLRKYPAFRAVPVIMLTGKATREAVLQGMAGGADGYVTKPFEPDALMNAVRTVLGLPAKP